MKFKIPKISNYFRGIRSLQPLLPDNVLVFSRLSKNDLIGKDAEKHHHNRFVLIFNLKTRGCINLDGSVISLNPGQALLIFPFQFHHFLNIAKESIEWVIITFELHQAELLNGFRNLPVIVNNEVMETFMNLVRSTQKKGFSFQKPDNGFILRTALILEGLLSIRKKRISKFTQESPLETTNRLFLEKINNALWKDINVPKSVGDLSKLMGYSESHFRSLFRKRMGYGAGQYLRKIYILQAAALVHQSDFNISEIAERCGFHSVYSFSRSFKKLMGKSPNKYRQQSHVEKAIT
jgi:AraC-like DNA-binding protein